MLYGTKNVHEYLTSRQKPLFSTLSEDICSGKLQKSHHKNIMKSK